MPPASSARNWLAKTVRLVPCLVTTWCLLPTPAQADPLTVSNLSNLSNLSSLSDSINVSANALSISSGDILLELAVSATIGLLLLQTWRKELLPRLKQLEKQNRETKYALELSIQQLATNTAFRITQFEKTCQDKIKGVSEASQIADQQNVSYIKRMRESVSALELKDKAKTSILDKLELRQSRSETCENSAKERLIVLELNQTRLDVMELSRREAITKLTERLERAEAQCQRLEQIEESAREQEAKYNQLLEWAIADKFLTLVGDSESRKQAALSVIRELQAEDRFVQLATRYPNPETIAVMETMANTEANQEAIVNAMLTLAESKFSGQDFAEAKRWHFKALARVQRNAPIQVDKLCLCLFRLAAICRIAPDANDARAVLAELKQWRTKLAGGQLRNLVEALEELASSFESLGDPVLQEQAYLMVLEIHLSQGTSSPELVRVLEHLGRLYARTDRFQEAETAYLKAIEVMRSLYKSTDGRVFKVLRALAHIYEEQNKVDHAGKTYACLASLAIEVRNFENAVLALDALERLAITYSQFMHDKAIEVWKVCERCYRQIDPTHPGVFRQLGHLADWYRSSNNTSELRDTLERTYSVFKETFSFPPENLVTTVLELASIYATTQNAGSEEALLIDALAFLGEQHVDSKYCLQLLERLAKTRVSRGLYADAELSYRRIAEIYISLFGDTDEGLVEMYGNIGTMCVLQNNHAQAEETFKKQLALAESLYGTKAEETLNPLMQLIALYVAAGRLDDAAPCYKLVLEVRTAVSGAEHESVMATLVHLAELERLRGNSAESGAFYNRAVELAQRLHPNLTEPVSVLEKYGGFKHRGNEASEGVEDRDGSEASDGNGGTESNGGPPSAPTRSRSLTLST